MGFLGRAIATVVSIATFGALGGLANQSAVLFSGKVAGLQFESSDTAYLFSQTVGLGWISGILSILFVLSLYFIWRKAWK
jgi:hypothetical protein